MTYTESEVINRMADVCMKHSIAPKTVPAAWVNKLIDFFTGMPFPSDQHCERFMLYMLQYKPISKRKTKSNV